LDRMSIARQSSEALRMCCDEEQEQPGLLLADCREVFDDVCERKLVGKDYQRRRCRGDRSRELQAAKGARVNANASEVSLQPVERFGVVTDYDDLRGSWAKGHAGNGPLSKDRSTRTDRGARRGSAANRAADAQ